MAWGKVVRGEGSILVVNLECPLGSSSKDRSIGLE